jgi:hypothetical protein
LSDSSLISWKLVARPSREARCAVNETIA